MRPMRFCRECRKRWVTTTSSTKAPTIPMMGEMKIVTTPDRERTLKFKGVTFLARLPDEIMEFFEDTGDIQHDEMMMLDVAFPNQYKKIKEAWTTAYLQLQFEKD